MSDPRSAAQAPGGAGRRLAIRRWLLSSLVAVLGLVWLAITLFGLDALPSLDDCSLHEEAHASAAESTVYDTLMRLRFRDAGGPSQVRLVSISPNVEPLNITTNTCDGRRFLTDLINRLNVYGPRVIAIDKFFSDGSCVNDTVNKAFREALAGSDAQIVVGQATHQRPVKGEGADCLVETPLFSFDAGEQAPKHPVLPGLTRLNQDERKIPLQWAVYADNKAAQQGGSAAARRKDGFAWVAAQALRQDLRSRPNMQELLRRHQQPYGALKSRLPSPISAMQILCVDPAGVNQHGWGTCSEPVATPDLHGKAVVIGEFSDSDLQQTAAGDVYGADLQARYIDDLVAGRYLRTFPYWGDFAVVCCFLILYALFDLKYVASGGEEQEHKALGYDTAMLFAFILFWLILLWADYVAPFCVLMSWLLLLLVVGRWAFWALSQANRERLARGEV